MDFHFWILLLTWKGLSYDGSELLHGLLLDVIFSMLSSDSSNVIQNIKHCFKASFAHSVGSYSEGHL